MSIKQRLNETKQQYFRRRYKDAQGDVCALCSLVEDDYTKRHAALVECESAHGESRCGRKVCAHHFVLRGELPICCKCNGGTLPNDADLHLLTLKPAKAVQVSIFDVMQEAA